MAFSVTSEAQNECCQASRSITAAYAWKEKRIRCVCERDAENLCRWMISGCIPQLFDWTCRIDLLPSGYRYPAVPPTVSTTPMSFAAVELFSMHLYEGLEFILTIQWTKVSQYASGDR